MMLECIKCKKQYGKPYKSVELHNKGLCEKCIKKKGVKIV